MHGVRRRLSAEFIKQVKTKMFGVDREIELIFCCVQVLALSDGLNLNEFDCVDLLWRAFQQVPV